MLDECMTNQHRKGHARAQIIADAAHCRGYRRFWAGGRQTGSNPDRDMRIGTDKFHKGVKEKTLLLWPEFSCRPAHPIEQDCSGLPFRELGTPQDCYSAARRAQACEALAPDGGRHSTSALAGERRKGAGVRRKTEAVKNRRRSPRMGYSASGNGAGVEHDHEGL